MKKYIIFFVLCLFVQQNLWGKIKNGYEVDINGIRLLLSNLQNIVDQDHHSDQEANKLSVFQKGQLNNKMKSLKEYIFYYELTEKLLVQFQSIAPDLYHEINTIKDGKGRGTDVYVKFIPEEQMRSSISGTTNIAQAKNDPTAYHSEYETHTVSVKIAIGKKALLLLAHELGHVKYQVPNLTSYAEYYKKYYQQSNFHAIYIGHNNNDLSGQYTRAYEKKFRLEYITISKARKPK